uniref:Uncharacterized protein n=1 Tax=Rhizophora mucronata TaxID=61149 RepID=A0A2P2R4R9_RHIMU
MLDQSRMKYREFYPLHAQNLIFLLPFYSHAVHLKITTFFFFSKIKMLLCF